MGRFEDPNLVKAEEAVDRVAMLSLSALADYRAQELNDDEFIKKLWQEFLAMADVTTVGAGTLHMAMSCYKLALAADKIHELEDQLDFHREAINMLTKLDEL